MYVIDPPQVAVVVVDVASEPHAVAISSQAAWGVFDGGAHGHVRKHGFTYLSHPLKSPLAFHVHREPHPVVVVLLVVLDVVVWGGRVVAQAI